MRHRTFDREGDPEHGQTIGTAISDQRVTDLFMNTGNRVARRQGTAPDFDELPARRKLSWLLWFQLGLPRYQLFRTTTRYCRTRRPRSAAEIRNSRLYQQTPERRSATPTGWKIHS